MRSYYPTRAPGQMQGIVTRPAVGLNEYTPPTALNDNFLSDCLDCELYREEAIKFYLKQSSDVTFYPNSVDAVNYAKARGQIMAAVSDQPQGDDPRIIMLVVDPGDSNKVYVKELDLTDYGIGEYEVTGSGITADGSYFSSTLYKTEAYDYAVFTSSSCKKLVWFRPYVTGVVDLPFYPKKIASHVNRIFAIDTGNKLWWCRAGDFFSWYSMEYDDDALMASADMKNGAYTLSTQPVMAGVLTATVTATSAADTMGTLAVVGSYLGVAQSETLVPIAGQRVQTVKTYDAWTSITGSGWSATAGADKITFGVGPAGGYVQEDSGYWTIEKERRLCDLDVMSDTLYIFTTRNIYAFLGTEPANFQLKLEVSNVGVSDDGSLSNNLVASNNRLFFMFNHEIYEYDAFSRPRIISNPTMVNNALTNGVMGGIKLNPSSDGTFYWELCADSNFLYVYRKGVGASDEDIRYQFDLKSRTWWKYSNPDLRVTGIVLEYDFFLIPSYDNKVAHYVGYGVLDGEYQIFYCSDLGFIREPTTGTGYGCPYIITKAYNTNPSELGTLTTLILMLSGASGEKADFSVLYSLTTTADDFVEIYSEEDHLFTGDIEIVEIPVPVSYIANAHHYRLKIISEGDALYLYNIERRFRVRGRSR